jgi:hypothetical protein
MELRDVLLVFHIAGAGTWLGANIIQAVVPAAIAGQGSEAEAAWYRVAGGLSRRLYMPAAILILITGIWMVSISDIYTFGSPFVGIGFVAIVIGALLGILVFGPGSTNAAEAIVSGDGAAIKATKGRLTLFGVIDTLIILLTITAMVLRLGA